MKNLNLICRTISSFSWLTVTPKTPRAEPPTTPAGHREAWHGRPSVLTLLCLGRRKGWKPNEDGWSYKSKMTLSFHISCVLNINRNIYICKTNTSTYIYVYTHIEHASFRLCFLKVLPNLSTWFKEHPHGFHWTMLVSSTSLTCIPHFLHRKQETTMITTHKYMYLNLYRSKSLRFKITIREANVLANVLGWTNTWNVTSTTKSLLSKIQEKNNQNHIIIRGFCKQMSGFLVPQLSFDHRVKWDVVSLFCVLTCP